MSRRRFASAVACALAAPAAARAADARPGRGGTATPDRRPRADRHARRARRPGRDVTRHAARRRRPTSRSSARRRRPTRGSRVATALVAADGKLRGPLADRRHRPPAHARDRAAHGRGAAPRSRSPRRTRPRSPSTGPRRELVRPRVLRPQDRVRPADVPHAARRRAQAAAVRHPVALTYGGRTIIVPVVDRGPFKPGRRWDLTAPRRRRSASPSRTASARSRRLSRSSPPGSAIIRLVSAVSAGRGRLDRERPLGQRAARSARPARAPPARASAQPTSAARRTTAGSIVHTDSKRRSRSGSRCSSRRARPLPRSRHAA